MVLKAAGQRHLSGPCLPWRGHGFIFTFCATGLKLFKIKCLKENINNFQKLFKYLKENPNIHLTYFLTLVFLRFLKFIFFLFYSGPATFPKPIKNKQ